MKFTIVCFVILIFPKLIFSIHIYHDGFNNNNLNKNNKETGFDYDTFDSSQCSDNKNCKNRLEDNSSPDYWRWNIMKRRPKNEITGAPDTFSTSSSLMLACSCGMESRLLDLGHQYYPRYLQTGLCRADGCGGPYRCVEKHYKVRVLKLKDSSNFDLELMAEALVVPTDLRDSWQPELISVTVACECVI